MRSLLVPLVDDALLAPERLPAFAQAYREDFQAAPPAVFPGSPRGGAGGPLHPRLTLERAVEQRLKDTARDLGPAGYDRRYGAGLLDAGAALAP